MSPHLQHISKASTMTYRMPHTRATGRVTRAMMPQMMNEMGLQATMASEVRQVSEVERDEWTVNSRAERCEVVSE